MTVEINFINIILFLLSVSTITLSFIIFYKNKVYKQNILDINNEYEEQLKELETLAVAKSESIEKAYSDVMKTAEKELEVYQKYILNLNTAIHLSDEKLKELDARGTFEADDEIGFFFNAVKTIQNILNEFKVEVQKN